MPIPSPSASPRPVRLRRLEVLAALGLGLAVWVVFKEAAEGQFLNWDDDINLTTNPHLQPLSLENVIWMLTDFSWMRRYVPVAWLGWAAERAAFGSSAWVAHVGNLFFHFANAYLVFTLLLRLLERRTEASDDQARKRLGLAFLLTLLWALHPLRVETVAWASGRLYLQATFFALLAVLAYLRSQMPATRRPHWWRAGAVVLFSGSLLTYPIALGLPAALLLIETCVTGRLDWRKPLLASPANRRVWLEQLPFVAVSVLALAMTLWARARAAGIWAASANGAFEFSDWVRRLMRGCYHWLHALWRPFVPFDLSPVYTDLLDPTPWPTHYIAGTIIVLALSAGLVWYARRDYRPLSLWLCHLVFFLPCIGLTESLHYPSDRYTYLHAVIVMAVIGFWIMRWSERRVALSLIALAAALGLLASQQVKVWRDDEILLRRALAKVGNHVYRGDLTWRLANALSRAGRKEEARLWYEETLRIALDPLARAAAHHGLGMLALEKGDESAALANCRIATTLAPHLALYHQWHAYLLLRAGHRTEAAEAVRKGLQSDPFNPELRQYAEGLRQLLQPAHERAN